MAPVSIACSAATRLRAAGKQSVSFALTELREKYPDKNPAIAGKDLFDLYTSVDHVRRELASSYWKLR